VLNRDDEYARKLKVDAKTEVLWYGLGNERDLRAVHISSGFRGLRFEVQHGKLRFAVESPLMGRINVYNILAACGAGLSYALRRRQSRKDRGATRGAGAIRAGRPRPAVRGGVDYAHTDDALRNTIAVARG